MSQSATIRPALTDALATIADAPTPQPPIEVQSPLPPPASRRADVLAVASLALIVTISFADVIAGINNFYMRDLTRYYYPTKQILREIVYGGEFPYWNRYFSAGQPIAANPEHEVFYPLTWLILLPSYDFGYRMHVLVHLYIGLLGMYALLRSMGLRVAGAWFGAISFGLGGIYLSYVNLLPILFCAAWLPLTCMYVRKFLLEHRTRDFALGALFLGMQFLVGEPTTVMQTGLLLGMYALYRGWYSPRRVVRSLTSVMWVGIISIIAVTIGAAQIIPAIDHVGDSARSRAFEFDLVSAWSMPWSKYAELIYPNILGHIAIKQVMWYWGGGLYPGMGSPFLFSIYAGLATIALCIGGALSRARGARFVLLLCVISSLLALGGHTPLLKFLYDRGIATSIRYPEKFALIGIFAITVFAAQMLDRLLDGDESVRDGALGFAIAVTSVAAIIAIIGFTPHYKRAFLYVWGMTANAGSLWEVKVSHRDWMIAVGRGALLIGLLVTARFRHRRAWLAAGAAFVIADLTYCTYELNPRMPRRFFEPPPAAKQLPANRADYRVFHEADWYGQEEIARQYFSTGEAVYWIVRNGLFPMTPAGAGVRTVLERDYDKTALVPTIDLTDSIWDVKRSGRAQWWEPFMAMSNAWYRATYRPFPAEKLRVKGNFKNAAPIQFLPAEHYPRYYFADQIVTIRNRQDFLKKLIGEKFSSRVAFVSRPSFVPGEGTVSVVRETANTATLDVESRGEGLLVMSITPHKYWRISIDGAHVPSIVTNIAYQSIVVPPGRHRVVMEYSNDLIRICLVVSIITLLAMIALAIVAPRRATAIPDVAYEEPVHVVPTDDGPREEPVESP
jgi:hypothetical protein